MAFNRVQTKTGVNTQNSAAATFALQFVSKTVKNNAILVVTTFGHLQPTLVVTDTEGNTYYSIGFVWNSTANQGFAAYIAPGIVGGSLNTVTVQYNGTGGTCNFVDAFIQELSGTALGLLGTDGPIVTVATGTGSIADSGALVTAADGDCILGVFSQPGGSNTISSVNSPLTLWQDEFSTVGCISSSAQGTQVTHGSLDAVANLSGSSTWIAMIVAIEAQQDAQLFSANYVATL